MRRALLDLLLELGTLAANRLAERVRAARRPPTPGELREMVREAKRKIQAQMRRR